MSTDLLIIRNRNKLEKLIEDGLSTSTIVKSFDEAKSKTLEIFDEISSIPDILLMLIAAERA